MQTVHEGVAVYGAGSRSTGERTSSQSIGTLRPRGDPRPWLSLPRVRLNEGKFAVIANLFTEDGVLDFGHLGKATGRAELNVFFGSLPAGQSPQTSGQTTPRGISFVKQFIHNHVLDLQGDRGSGFSYLEARPTYKGESDMVAARDDDEYVIAWRCCARGGRRKPASKWVAKSDY